MAFKTLKLSDILECFFNHMSVNRKTSTEIQQIVFLGLSMWGNTSYVTTWKNEVHSYEMQENQVYYLLETWHISSTWRFQTNKSNVYTYLTQVLLFSLE